MYNPLQVSLDNIIPLTEARDHFSQIVAEVQKDKLYVLTKGGKPAVAIIDVKYLEQITGGNVNPSHIEAEIQKNPAKVGRPEMIKHETPIAPPPVPKPVEPPAAMTPPPPPPPAPPVPKPEPKPEPITPPPASPATPTPAPQATIESSFNNSLTNPPAIPSKPAETPAPPQNVGTLDVHPLNDADDQKEAPISRPDPDDTAGPAQYDNAPHSADNNSANISDNSSAEPDDMPID